MFTVFISASTELKELRDQVYLCLKAASINALVQDENLGETPSTVRNLLARLIDQSDVVLHLAGDHYGADAGRNPPPFPEAPNFECSWTQFEYYYAHQQGKDVYAFVMAPGDAPEVARAGWTPRDLTRRKALQQAHRQRVISGQFTDTPFIGLERTRNNPETVKDRMDMLKRLVAVVRRSQQDWGGCKDKVTLQLIDLSRQARRTSLYYFSTAAALMLVILVTSDSFVVESVCKYSIAEPICKNYGWGGLTTPVQDALEQEIEQEFAEAKTCQKLRDFIEKYPGHVMASRARDSLEITHELETEILENREVELPRDCERLRSFGMSFREAVESDHGTWICLGITITRKLDCNGKEIRTP